MDPRLLRAYNEELAYLRETSREFGAEHDVVAGYLGLKTPTDPDPYVERLLEGVAFLSARVKLKLDDQFPDFTQHLLQAIQPNYLAPTPSMCVVALQPQSGDANLASGPVVPRLSEMTAAAADHAVPVKFRTGQDVALWPLVLEEAEYLPSRAAVAVHAAAADVRADAGLRLKFRATAGVPLSALKITGLPLFIAGSEQTPGELYRQILGETVAAIAQPVGQGRKTWTRLPVPQAYGFDDDCALLPHEGRSFRGYRMLAEYFACPERFMFAELKGLDQAFAGAGDACEVVLLFSRSSSILHGAVSPANLRPYCTPAINLFEMQLGRTAVSPYEHEYQVIPDRTHPLDYEVFRIKEVVAHGGSGKPRPVAPLHAFGALLYDWREAIFFVTRLRPRRLSTKEQRSRRRTDYTGTETFISLTSPGSPDGVSGVQDLAIRAFCTNRELPELLRFTDQDAGFVLTGAPIKGVEVLRPPTRPRPPLGMADAAWRVIGHLTPNYTSLAPEGGDDPSLLRNHLALYGRSDDPTMRRQIDGVLAVSSKPVTRRVPGIDRMAFARGRRIRVRLDDASFDNSRMFLFATVIDRFLSEFASINAFTETVFESPDQGEFAKWPPRMGLRPTI
ncbi:MAG TPA: type VI secretion system baseplate subunit TssF [Caulobacteraceae bacterium]|nr:type VI secretion system baseplate subunit TssF [Caulobacteraceae bacterium]